jgi:hypothetical protein
MQRLDRWRTWDQSSVQMHAFSIESSFLGCRQQFPGRAMNRFLAVADVLGCGELVEVKGWVTKRQACRGPLIKSQRAILAWGGSGIILVYHCK